MAEIAMVAVLVGSAYEVSQQRGGCGEHSDGSIVEPVLLPMMKAVVLTVVESHRPWAVVGGRGRQS
jgi:hypothetical protein